MSISFSPTVLPRFGTKYDLSNIPESEKEALHRLTQSLEIPRPVDGWVYDVPVNKERQFVRGLLVGLALEIEKHFTIVDERYENAAQTGFIDVTA